LEKDSETFPSFLSKVPFIYILKFLDFITCNDEVNKHVVEKEKIKIGDEREREKIKYANGGRRAENKICDNYQFILS
jgi:hypothetical protein